jgi:hypothetical protein
LGQEWRSQKGLDAYAMRSFGSSFGEHGMEGAFDSLLQLHLLGGRYRYQSRVTIVLLHERSGMELVDIFVDGVFGT